MFKFIQLILLLCLVATAFQQNVQQQQAEDVPQQDEAPDSGSEPENTVVSSQSVEPDPSADTQSNQGSEALGTAVNDVSEAPMPYSFGYDSGDESGNKLSRAETSDENGAVKGSYSYLDADGLYRTVEYVADKQGFRANIKTNEPGLNARGETAPAGVTIVGEQTPSNILNRLTNLRPKFIPATPIQQIQQQDQAASNDQGTKSTASTSQAPTKSLPSATNTRPPVKSLPQATTGSPNLFFVQSQSDKPQFLASRTVTTLNPVLRMFRLVPMINGKPSVQSPSLIMIIPEETPQAQTQFITQTQQQQEPIDETFDSPVTTEATTTRAPSTTARPTERSFMKTFMRIGTPKTAPSRPVVTVRRVAPRPTTTTTTEVPPVKGAPSLRSSTKSASDGSSASFEAPVVKGASPSIPQGSIKSASVRFPIKSASLETPVVKSASFRSPARVIRVERPNRNY
ncbi:uncharacterized protein LOC141850022 [Brevipalpus obovatus]|uniref:uncharacterized protein LOC141850022 n=1 Tax=Brevipalpus obovatus TaxID=246614 RepID=UPI003D9E997A